MPPILSTITLRLTRTFNASRQRVFQAWTEPEALKKLAQGGFRYNRNADGN